MLNTLVQCLNHVSVHIYGLTILIFIETLARPYLLLLLHQTHALHCKCQDAPLQNTRWASSLKKETQQLRVCDLSIRGSCTPPIPTRHCTIALLLTAFANSIAARRTLVCKGKNNITVQTLVYHPVFQAPITLFYQCTESKINLQRVSLKIKVGKSKFGH